MSCIKSTSGTTADTTADGLGFNAFPAMQPRPPAPTPQELRNGRRVKDADLPPEGVYLPNNNVLTPHMRSPEYVQMSTAAADDARADAREDAPLRMHALPEPPADLPVDFPFTFTLVHIQERFRIHVHFIRLDWMLAGSPECFGQSRRIVDKWTAPHAPRLPVADRGVPLQLTGLYFSSTEPAREMSRVSRDVLRGGLVVCVLVRPLVVEPAFMELAESLSLGDLTGDEILQDLLLGLPARLNQFEAADVVHDHAGRKCRSGLNASHARRHGTRDLLQIFQILLLGPWIKRATAKNIRMLMVPQNRNDLISITQLCEAGKIVPVIDRRYSLSEVPEALRYIVEGHAKGKVVITVH